MEAKCIANTKLSRDVIALYMIADKYKLNFLSLLALYEIYERDVFVFFYILSEGNDESIIGLSPEKIELKDVNNLELPKESNLKLILSKAKKVSDALRRNTDYGLTSATLPWYEALKPYCTRNAKNPSDVSVNFYSHPVPVKKKEMAQVK